MSKELLATCRVCREKVSNNARSCPHCGAPFPAKKEWKGTGVDWKSPMKVGRFPLVHIAFGRTEEGRLRVAKGVVAIGQFGIGVVTMAQAGVGFLFGLGQFILGFVAVAQFALAVYFGLGQFAAGYIAIGQFALGYYVLAQTGLGKYVWSAESRDPAAVQFFEHLSKEAKLFVRRYLAR